MSIVQAALLIASQGFAVFPCDREKKPLTSHGFKDATRDPDTIGQLFQQPRAAMIGIPTGKASNLIVVDVDVKNGARGKEWLDAVADRLPQTRAIRTRSGGAHLWFLCPPGVEIRNSASKIAAGVDVRGEGGYIIAPPSPGYSVENDAPPAEMPQWLVDACGTKRREAPTAAKQPAPQLREVLRAECERVAAAQAGGRNDRLNEAAFAIGELVANGLRRNLAVMELAKAARAAGLEDGEIHATIQSGLLAGVRDAEWPEPDLSLIEERIFDAPAFPLTLLPPFFAKWVAEAAEGASAPPAFVGTALLGVCGALIGNARSASPWTEWAEPPALNIALIGRPSSGKSPALDRLVKLLSRIEAIGNADWQERKREWKRQFTEYAERMRKYQIEVKEAVKRGYPAAKLPADCVEPKPIERRRISSSDTTIEKAVRLSAANPRGMLLLRDELSGWLASMDRYANGSGGDRPFWLQAYGARPYTADRVKDGTDQTFVPHLFWAIAGTIQPDRVTALMTAGGDDGLTARFLYCWPDPLPPRRPSRAADTERAFKALLRLRELEWQESPEPKIVPFDEQAATIVQEWREQVAQMEAEAAGLMLSWIGKMPGMAVRLALILEYLAWATSEENTPEPGRITEWAITAAVTFLEDFALPMARRTFGAAALPQAEQDVRKLARWLKRQNPMPDTINARLVRLRGGGPGIPDADRMEAALRDLEAFGWVRPMPSRDGNNQGRQRKDWAVNPKLAEARP